MSHQDVKLPTGVKLPRLNFSLSLGKNKNPINTPKFIYDYDVGLLQNNKVAINLQNKIGREIRSQSLKQHTKYIQKKKHQPPAQYNKWYIEPTKRYISSQQNPKQSTPSQNPQYIYDNLHNKQFWNWVHPLQAKNSTELQKQKQQKEGGNDTNQKQIDRNRLNMRILLQFKKTMEQSKKRVPLVIEEMFSSKK